MEITGKIIALLQEQSGQGKNGIWRKKEFVIETPSQYPKKVCIAIWGDKIDQSPLTIGETVTVSFDIESREYNGKWFTEVKAWKVAGSNSGVSAEVPPQNFEVPPVNEDDLPF